jgi:hypothetical protein
MLHGSNIRAAEQALEHGDDEAREIALQLLREVRKIPAETPGAKNRPSP